MKTKIFTSLAIMFFSLSLFAQRTATVSAVGPDISENLDLRAVASIFGDSQNLEDFEQRLNDPRNQISNLDLDGDNRVDYLRVIETVENYTHLIAIQAVIGRDIFQDVATLEVDRNRSRNVTFQIVGNPYFYGTNYIYEPVYVSQPVIYNYFYVSNYRPYRSVYYYNYYPQYFTYWQPYPVYRYRRNVYRQINSYNSYNYVNYRRNDRAAAIYQSQRANGYATMYPNRSFEKRHATIANAHDLPVRTTTSTGGIRNNPAPVRTGIRTDNTNVSQPIRTTSANTASNGSVRNNYVDQTPRNPTEGSVATPSSGVRSNSFASQTPQNPAQSSIKNNSNASGQAGSSVRSTRSFNDPTPRPSYMGSTPRSNAAAAVKNTATNRSMSTRASAASQSRGSFGGR